MSHNVGETSHVQKIAQLVTVMVEDRGLKYTQIRELMAAYLKWDEYDIDRFNRNFRGKETSGNKQYDLKELVALIHVLTQEVSLAQRCKAEEAFQLFNLAHVPLENFKILKAFFPEKEYRTAWKPYIYSEITVDDLQKDQSFIKPIYPHVFIGRDDDLAILQGRLGVNDARNQFPVTVVRGWPGVGKTTLVNRLVYDEDQRLRPLYPDGILWASLGPQGDILQILRKWARQIGATHIESVQKIEDVVEQMRFALQGKQILLVIDDVWNEAQGNLLKSLRSDQTTFLFATRFTDLAYESLADTAQDVYPLSVLTDEQSIQLLQVFAPNGAQEYADQMVDLVRTLEGLPLALRVAGRLIEEEWFLGIDAQKLFTDLQTNFRGFQDKAPAERFNEATGQTPTIGLLFKMSVQTLVESEQQTFACIGAFAPKPATFELRAMVKICGLQDPGGTVRALVGRGLLEPLGQARFQMHYTLSMYAKHLLDTDLAELQV